MKFKSLFKIALTFAAAIFVASCSKDNDGEITPDHETSKDDNNSNDKRETYNISFNGEQVGTDRFMEVFEFVDSKGNAIAVADETTKKYRFREGLENWEYTTDASMLFSGFHTMTSVELPSSWENVTDVSSMFMMCVELIDYKLPNNWGKVTDVSGMFSFCKKLKKSSIPDNWGDVTSTSGLFEGCENISSITLPNDWAKVQSTLFMFGGCENLSSVTLPSDWKNVKELIGSLGMFNDCPMLKTKAPGIKVSDSYYKSPSKYVFPEECYNEHLGLDF